MAQFQVLVSMVKFFLLFFMSASCLAAPELIIECTPNNADGNEDPVTYILDTKEGIAEILHSNRAEKGVVGTDTHFYTLYFTRNKKTTNEILKTVVVNRITGQFTQTETSDSSYPNRLGPAVVGACKKSEYKRKL